MAPYAVGYTPYSAKHKNAAIHKSTENGYNISRISFTHHGVFFFSVILLSPYYLFNANAFSSFNPSTNDVSYLIAS